ncbi:hypothetical protein DQ384_04505 [Sphaerisporangium album]|uniref:Uncharacterized protein n=1 Tax=Sphaerisporangium album TaxID=509200 RepID=A0A367FSH5_9ACTN|nr:hypothetical protein [Sphaerisporangium album]RCG32742.1 hypothetical protein DQ384_04505 [Sphaerisporangium album]
MIDHPDGTIEVKLMRPEEPRISHLTPDMRKFWALMFAIEHPPPERLWKKYLEAVLRCGNGRF